MLICSWRLIECRIENGNCKASQFQAEIHFHPPKSLKQFTFYCTQIAISLQLLENVRHYQAWYTKPCIWVAIFFFPRWFDDEICKPLRDLPITSRQFNFLFFFILKSKFQIVFNMFTANRKKGFRPRLPYTWWWNNQRWAWGKVELWKVAMRWIQH